MSKPIIINKFGGGILTKDLIPFIKERIKDQLDKNYSPIAIVSAMPGVTDNLINFLEKLKENYNESNINNFIISLYEQHDKIMQDIKISGNLYEESKIELKKLLDKLGEELKNKEKVDSIIEDKIVSFGEKLSAIIFTKYLNINNIEALEILAENIPIITDNNFKNANIEYAISEKNVREKVSNIDKVIVIPGFTGITKDGDITTLGRGGTDTTACFIGASLRADKIILWKDVGGVLSSDPKIIPKAKTIPFINYYEAEEAGKVIHDKAIPFIKMFKTKIEIASIADPKLKTEIGDTGKIKNGAKILSIKKDLDFILITDENAKTNDLLLVASEIFKKYKIDITLISNTKYSIQILTDNKNGELENACKDLSLKVQKLEKTKAEMIFLVGLFNAKDVSNFNDLLVKKGADLLISAFYYEDCYRMEAVIRTDDINEIMKSIYKKFIK